MDLNTITPLILTYNEEPNIDRTLHKLTWAKEVIVIDSFSTDKTIEILKSYSNVKVFFRKFESFAKQCNYGLSLIKNTWVLSLDGDYILSDDLINKLTILNVNSEINGYLIPLSYCIFGKPLKKTILPPRICLYKKNTAHYRDDGHAHKVIIEGKVSYLKSYIYHDDRKSLSRWLWAQDRYMVLEVEKILNTPFYELSLSDRIRKQIILAPFIVFIYCLFLKGGIFDGWGGWYYAFQRMFAEILLSLRLIENKYFNS
ncbi:glycosyltransferase family 2 protein [Geminocystis sp. NIES-3709]|uniref:glycosyltransferase family 2 protein n=1 Tax=Geminocystis sp. NIES-3709 TaxID=1617448 RepID=UPI0005FC4395|nr:glycosyltransferase family 2 protein [Geminocystis sp. NIES-3709]BAQ66289.1 glycosyltransferase [Geminocystis sp. NIES-3709]